MTETVLPDIGEVVHSIVRALEEKIEPGLTTLAERSAITTSKHLLRYVAARLELEGQALLDETKLLGKLLLEAAVYLEDEGETQAASHLAASIRATLARPRDPALYPTLAIMAAEVGPLRGLVHRLVEYLVRLGKTRSSRAEALHQDVRGYIAWQLRQEATYMEAPFRGFGARR